MFWKWNQIFLTTWYFAYNHFFASCTICISLSFQLQETKRKLQIVESQLHDKDKQLVGMDTELRHLNRNILTLEADKAELKSQVC